MVKTIGFAIILGITMVLSLIGAGIYILLGAFHLNRQQHRFLYLVTRGWAKWMVVAVGTKMHIENADQIPKGPVLFVANHQSYFDIVALMACLPEFAAFVAKVELANIPILSWWMKKMGCLFLDRENMRQSLKVILKGIDMLKEGTNLVIFPEGTRGKHGQMSDFKQGSLKLAVKAGVPIVPVTLVDSYKVFEENHRVTKTDVSVIFHEPIDVNALSRDEVNELHITVHEIIKQSLER